MSTHPNAAVVRRFFDALSVGDLDASIQILAPDVSWHLPCGGTVLGQHRDLVGLEELGRSMAANLTASEATFRFDVQAIYAGDEFCVAVSRNSAQARGKMLDISMAISLMVVDGHIVEVWEAPDDIEAFIAFWRS